MHPKTCLFLLFAIILAGNLSGQIYAPAASDSFTATYNADDKVFIFNIAQYQGAHLGSLTAVSIDRLSGWDFQWSVYNPVSHIYTPIPGSTSGWISTVDTITVSSGYQVVMTKGASTAIYRVWLLFNDYNVEITNKDEENHLIFGYFNCSSLDLRADTTADHPLYYYNPATQSRINVFNNYTIRWKTDNINASIPASRLITRVNNPPSEDTWYILTLTDRFDLQRADSVFYESIVPEAKLTATYVNLSDSEEYPGRPYGNYYEDAVLSAPGKYRFDLSASKNAVGYEMRFGDGIVFETDSDTGVIVHEYEKPGKYKAVLIAKSAKPYECIDSVSAEAELVYARFLLPNVFSPNNDGDNDLLELYDNNNIFRSEDVSVVSIDIAIFNRAGRKVHAFAGSIRDWQGWNGNIMESEREAPEGVYFYVISVFFAYEDKENPISHEVMKGFFHLFRE